LNLVILSGGTLSQMCLGTIGTKALRMRASYFFSFSWTMVGLSALTLALVTVAIFLR